MDGDWDDLVRAENALARSAISFVPGDQFPPANLRIAFPDGRWAEYLSLDVHDHAMLDSYRAGREAEARRRFWNALWWFLAGALVGAVLAAGFAQLLRY